MPRDQNPRCSGLLDFTEIATRIWGIVTAIVLWGVGTDLMVHEHSIGSYILFLAALLTVLETSHFVQLFLELLIKDDKNICFQCCRIMQVIDLWKKSLIYVFFAVFCFLKPSSLWLATVGGTMMIILAILYLILSYKIKLAMSETYFDRDSSYDRFDDLQDEIDDSLPEPSSDHVGDQNAILQV